MLGVKFYLIGAIASAVTCSALANGYSNRDIIYNTELKKVKPYRSCITEAARSYEVPEWILMAVIRHENGPLNGYLVNPNGTKDYGVTCINDVRIADFHNAGMTEVTAQKIMNDPCYAIYVTSYLLKKEYMKEQRVDGERDENVWLVATANYHYNYKGKYPDNHNKYLNHIKKTLARFQRKLDKYQ